MGLISPNRCDQSLDRQSKVSPEFANWYHNEFQPHFVNIIMMVKPKYQIIFYMNFIDLWFLVLSFFRLTLKRFRT